MSDWMTIRVVLTGRGGRSATSPPGRVLLAHADHAFADLAEAIDTAFGRWDLTPVHQFEVEGRLLLTAGAGGEADAEAEDSDEVTLGEVGLRVGARFVYIFDLGESWTHECNVEAIGIDPFELAGEEPGVPVPIYGWGTIPDQYGRRSEDDEGDDGEGDEAAVDEDAEAFGGRDEPDVEDAEPEQDLDDEGEDDEDWDAATEASWAVVARALVDVQHEPAPEELSRAVSALRSAAGGGPQEAAPVLWAAAGIDPAAAPTDDEALWIELAAGVVHPQGDVPLADDRVLAWGALEPADWAGAVIELMRSGPGTSASPMSVLDLITRCPEVESDELSADDEELILEGLEIVAWLWQALGAVDDDGALTPLGAWGLPLALQHAWDVEG